MPFVMGMSVCLETEERMVQQSPQFCDDLADVVVAFCALNALANNHMSVVMIWRMMWYVVLAFCYLSFFEFPVIRGRVCRTRQ
jgi:hypothetical protein